MEQNENVFSIYVENLGEYNSGRSVGGWLQLPKTESEIDDFLKNTVKLDDNSEHIITDYDCSYDFVGTGEYENVYDLNMLAKAMSNLSVDEIAMVQGYIDYHGEVSLLEATNICLQVQDIAYHEYSINDEDWTPEEAYGRTLAENRGITEYLENNRIEHLFDFEQYGTEDAINEPVQLLDKGFIDYDGSGVVLDFYSKDEIKEELGMQGDSPELNNSKQDIDKTIGGEKRPSIKDRIQSAKQNLSDKPSAPKQNIKQNIKK